MSPGFFRFPQGKQKTPHGVLIGVFCFPQKEMADFVHCQ